MTGPLSMAVAAHHGAIARGEIVDRRPREPTPEMVAAFQKAHDAHAAAKIPKIYARGQREQANVTVGLRAALAVEVLGFPVVLRADLPPGTVELVGRGGRVRIEEAVASQAPSRSLRRFIDAQEPSA